MATELTKDDIDLVPMELDYMTDELKARAVSELNEDDNKTVQCLDSLRAMLKEEDDLRWQDDDLFLMGFLRAKKFDVAKAFGLIKGLYVCMGKHSHIFYNFSCDYFKRIMGEKVLAVLPYRDSEGSVVCVVRPGVWNTAISSVEDHLACATVGIILALLSPSTQVAGFRVILDFKGFSMQQFIRTSINEVKFFSDLMQHTVPMRIRGIHVINENVVFFSLWAIFKLFLSKKLRNRVHLHGTDFKRLHESFHPSILPADWGGQLPPLDNSDWSKKMEESYEYIQHVLSFGYKKYLKTMTGKTEPSESVSSLSNTRGVTTERSC